jgi:hypothetical protein
MNIETKLRPNEWEVVPCAEAPSHGVVQVK